MNHHQHVAGDVELEHSGANSGQVRRTELHMVRRANTLREDAGFEIAALDYLNTAVLPAPKATTESRR